MEANSALLRLPDSIEDKVPLDDDHLMMLKFDTKDRKGYSSANEDITSPVDIHRDSPEEREGSEAQGGSDDEVTSAPAINDDERKLHRYPQMKTITTESKVIGWKLSNCQASHVCVIEVPYSKIAE